MLSNAFGDPISGLGGTVAVLAALDARSRDGKGRLLECAQLEGFMPMVSEALVRYQRTGEMPQRRGNRRVGHEPSGCFALGDDRWLVIDVQTGEQWTALAPAIAQPGTDSPEFRLAEGRAAHRDELLRAIQAWVDAAGEGAVQAACERAGVPCSLVLNESDVLGLEPLLASEFWQGMERDPVGFHLYPTVAYNRAGSRPLTERPAPFVGQDTEAILIALGYSEEAHTELVAAGVTGKLLVSTG